MLDIKFVYVHHKLSTGTLTVSSAYISYQIGDACQVVKLKHCTSYAPLVITGHGFELLFVNTVLMLSQGHTSSPGSSFQGRLVLNVLYVFKISKPPSFGPRRDSNHNLLILGQTPKPSYLLACSTLIAAYLRVLIWKVQWIEAAQALRMSDAQANFIFFKFLSQ